MLRTSYTIAGASVSVAVKNKAERWNSIIRAHAVTGKSVFWACSKGNSKHYTNPKPQLLNLTPQPDTSKPKSYTLNLKPYLNPK